MVPLLQFSSRHKFSSDLNEENPFWGNMKDINLYVQRSQYVLRSGRPQADVLIYFPFCIMMKVLRILRNF